MGRDQHRHRRGAVSRISIHAPRMGRDAEGQKQFGKKVGFQSTRPAWGATRRGRSRPRRDHISIHAPRMGRDTLAATLAAGLRDFNPRAPHGARLQGVFPWSCYPDSFQSTRPAWGATPRRLRPPRQKEDFNPRAPHGARRVDGGAGRGAGRISIHAPRMGRDSKIVQNI